MTSYPNSQFFRSLSVLFLLAVLFPSPTVGRIGGTSSTRSEQEDHRKRYLAGQYGYSKHHGQYGYQKVNNSRGNVYIKPITIPKHYGHYDYYYIKRPVEDPRKNNPPPPSPTNKPSPYSYPAPVPAPTNPYIPVSGPVTSNTPRPTLVPTVQPIPNPTSAPTKAAITGAPVEPPTPAPLEPTSLSTAPEPAPTSFFGDKMPTDQQTVITFEPPTKVQLRIAEYAIQGGAEFEDPESYQSAALKRVEEQEGVDLFSDAKLMQYYALYCIFEATNSKSNEFIKSLRAFGEDELEKIPGWTIQTGWTETNLDPCEGEWYGVACVDDKVVNLDLFDNNLTGNFAPEVVYLAGDGFFSTGAGNLVALDIFNNELMSNNGDNSWISELGSQLGYLYFQNTMFTGKLPGFFPKGLIELDIANSMITGELPGQAFEGLDSLRFLLMDGVQFNSPMPIEIARLPNLEYLFATDAMITGDLSYMKEMSIIFEHWVDRNPQLGGTIPSFLGELTTLQSFSIAECGFTGTIPESLGNLELMQQMWLYGNQLSGEIPAALGDLKFMRIFEVEGNNLSDSMPESVCNNFRDGMLEILGADCDTLDCPCCTCCSVDECRASS